ncbi:MAG TPA: RNA polymerase sigma factor [Bryobacteraceae bacterium]|nr:RNA polymerase sigma factor [Bryobacteraceae bacterium]
MTPAIPLDVIGRTYTPTPERVALSGGEAGLVRRAQAADESAFRCIVERYQGKVLSTIRAVLHRNNDADDIAQQVFMKVYLGIHRFDSRGSLWAWVYRITVNECYDYLRKKKVRPLVYESDLGRPDDQSPAQVFVTARAPQRPVDDGLEQREFAVWLLQHISEQERVLLLMKEVQGCSVAELSALTGLTQNCIKIRLFRARRKMLKAAQGSGAGRPLKPGKGLSPGCR